MQNHQPSEKIYRKNSHDNEYTDEFSHTTLKAL